ncbi:hypothetical protein [Pseudomonas sp. BNK-43-a]|uniref:hypothetical protein n=1 Tax=unclassified Pseudomonas TaxID=196821 RepID=UPI0039BF3207
MGIMLKIQIKLGMVMKSKFLDKYVLVSFKPFLIGIGLGWLFIFLKFESFVEANASEILISWGAVIGASCMLVALIIGMVPKGKIRTYVLERVIKCTNFFVGMGLVSLASCIIYYARYGWGLGLSLMSIGGVVYWLGINRAFFQVLNLEMSKRDKVILLVFSLVTLILLAIFVSKMLSIGKI